MVISAWMRHCPLTGNQLRTTCASPRSVKSCRLFTCHTTVLYVQLVSVLFPNLHLYTKAWSPTVSTARHKGIKRLAFLLVVLKSHMVCCI